MRWGRWDVIAASSPVAVLLLPSKDARAVDQSDLTWKKCKNIFWPEQKVFLRSKWLTQQWVLLPRQLEPVEEGVSKSKKSYWKVEKFGTVYNLSHATHLARGLEESVQTKNTSPGMIV